MKKSEPFDENAFRRAADLLDDELEDESSGEIDPGDNTRIGRYRIIDQLGQGGMGIVYEAEQASPFRRVALKVIRHGPVVDDQQIRLFQREADTLARLKHPNIAAIYEAGRTEQNQHFFAMELVRGVPLTDFVNGKRLDGAAAPATRTQRLHLFRQICDAIHYAHQKGVIHRDLKPSNILVTDDHDSDSTGGSSGRGPSLQGPVVKILDFGLARITDGDLRATTVITEVGRVQGTLPYMSPEQARGNPDDIDVRTDVYALGVILYELLTDELPYQVSRHMITEAVRVICEESPKKPSANDRALRGDLETIVLKALEKDPDRRYASAAAVAEDIQCYLTNQPIHARPPSAMYQLRKLVTRHKGAFAAALAFIIVLTAAAIVSINQARIANEQAQLAESEAKRAEEKSMQLSAETERAQKFAEAAKSESEKAQQMADVAKAEEKKATQVTRFLTDMLSNAANEDRGPDLTVREVLDVAAEEMETKPDQEPEVEFAIRNAIANTYRKMGMYRDALPHMEAALKLDIQMHGEMNENVATEYNNIAGLKFNLHDLPGAEKYLTKALQINEKLHGPHHPSVIRFRSNLGSLYASLGRLDEAEKMFRKTASAPAQNTKDVLNAQDSAMLNLAKLLMQRGQYAEAESTLTNLIDSLNQRFGQGHARTLKAVLMLAELQHKTGRSEAAAKTMEQSIDIRRKLLGPEHPELAESLLGYGALVRNAGQYHRALELTKEALDIRRKVYGPEHPLTLSTAAQVAAIQRDLGQYDESATVIEELLTHLDENDPAAGNEFTQMLTELGKIRYRQGRNDIAALPLRKAYDMLIKQGREDTPDARETISVLGITEGALGNRHLAELLLRECLRLARQHQSGDHYSISVAVDHLARMIYELGYRDEAVNLARESIDETTRFLAPDHPKITGGLSTLAAMLTGLDQYEEAYDIAKKVVERETSENGSSHPAVANALTVLALTCYKTDRFEEAKNNYEQALAICNRIFSEPHPTHIKAARGVAYCRAHDDLITEAAAMFRETLKDMKTLNYENTVDFSESLGALAETALNQGDPNGAIHLAQSAYNIRAAQTRPDQDQLAQLRQIIEAAKAAL